jgi:hypothetical protein
MLPSTRDSGQYTETSNGSSNVGFYRGISNAYADQNVEDERDHSNRLRGLEQTVPPPTAESPGVRAKGGPYILPATTYQRLQKSAVPDVAMLDGTPISRPGAPRSDSRSPRFHEQFAELEGTASLRPHTQRSTDNSPTTDSPTLGRGPQSAVGVPFADEVRRRQHLASSNR